MVMKTKEYSVLHGLPPSRSRVMCFGFKIDDCTNDMQKEPEWHEVNFTLEVDEYRLKKEIPQDLQESILKEYIVSEHWKVDWYDDQESHVIGVTKWKYMEFNK